MMDILEAVEKNLVPVECISNKTECGIVCGRCATHTMWNQLWNLIVSTSSSITLYDVMKEVDSYGENDDIE